MPLILKGENVLLIAPIGSGKNQSNIATSFLNVFASTGEKRNVHTLYYTAQSSQSQFGQKHLFIGKHFRVRRKQALKPSDILIVTSETLQAILLGKLMQKHLSNVRFVIIDEVHELADSKRGVQLTVALERLRELTGRSEFQRIGFQRLLHVLVEINGILENVKQIMNKRLSGEKLAEEEIRTLSYARRIADLILSYGKQAVIVLQVMGVGPETASRILGKITCKREGILYGSFEG